MGVDLPDAANLATEDGPEGNRIPGGMARDLLDHLVTSIVEDPEAVSITASEREGRVDLSLVVGASDMGRVIGRKGRVAQALRTLVRVAGAREGLEATVDIVD